MDNYYTRYYLLLINVTYLTLYRFHKTRAIKRNKKKKNPNNTITTRHVSNKSNINTRGKR